MNCFKKLILVGILSLIPVNVFGQNPVTIAGPNPLEVDGSNGFFPGAINNITTNNYGNSETGVTGNNTGAPVAINSGEGIGTIIIQANCVSCSGGTTINFQQSVDGSNYFAVFGRQLTSGSTPVFASSTTTSGLTYWEVPAAGIADVRTTVTGYSAGTITTTVYGTTAVSTSGVYIGNATLAVTQSGTWSVAQGGTGGTAWLQKIADGTGSGVTATVDSTALALYTEIRDAAGNARGANVSAGHALLTDASATTQPTSIASGQVASGAIASGAVASGAYVSGSISDGAIVTLGNKADAKSTATDTTAISIMQVLKEISFMAQTPAALPANQSTNINEWDGAALAAPDANSYVISPNAATATAAAAASVCNILSAASNNTTNCKNAAGNLYGFEFWNTTTTVYYLRLYNLSTSPTCSSATGFIRSIPIPPAASAGLVGGAVNNYVVPVNFSTGIGYCITGGSSSTDNTNAAVGIFGEIRYK